MNLLPTDDLPNLPGRDRRPAKIMVLLMPGGDNQAMLAMAQRIAAVQQVLLLGVVPVPMGENLSVGQRPARQLRRTIQESVDRANLRAKARIRVSYSPWEEILLVLAEEPDVKLLVLSWPQQLKAIGLTATEILSHPPCDIAILRGPFPKELNRILLPNLGDPHGELALRLTLTLARPERTNITSLNLRKSDTGGLEKEIFAGMQLILEEMPEIDQQTVVVEDQAKTILDYSKEFDLVVMGTKAKPSDETDSFGQITDTILNKSPAAVIAVKTKKVVPDQAPPRRFGAGAISVLVDKWFAENTFHADEFADLARLVTLKEERGVTISLALPALNEEDTVGNVIRTCQRALMEQFPLLDEIVLMDSDSTDRTREIATDLGIPVYIHQEILPQYGPREGKGEALWKSLFVTKGDLIFWVDTDIRNFHSRFVYGLIGPLLQRTRLKFIKGFYRRPLKAGSQLKPGRGGRVTELTARPLLNLFYPSLSGVIQPLAGEYGGRREVLEKMPFSSGYGVEIGLLIDIFEKYKLSSIAQVDLVERIHKNQSLTNLSKMSFAIIQTLIHKIERRYGQEILDDVNRTMKIVRYEPGRYYLDVEEIAELERPAMADIPEYCENRGVV